MRQLEFNLTPRAEHDGEAAPWRYRFTKNALVEELDGNRHVYGLWESLFGCWIVDPVTRRSYEIIPTWRPLNQNGVWRDQREIRFHAAPVYRGTTVAIRGQCRLCRLLYRNPPGDEIARRVV